MLNTTKLRHLLSRKVKPLSALIPISIFITINYIFIIFIPIPNLLKKKMF